MSKSFDDIPENLLLFIFSHLQVKELCIAGGVCRKWRRVTNDNSLWRHVDLTPYRLNLKKTWKVIRAHMSDCLLDMSLRGFMDTGTATKWKSETLSNAMLDDLRERCPNIRELHLHRIYLENLDATKLPPTLVKLSLIGCQWPPRWLKTAPMLQLQYLNVSGCSRVDNQDLEDFTRFSSVEQLYLNGCYRVKEAGLQKVSENFLGLTHLEMDETGCTDLSIHHISRNQKFLRHLSIRKCENMNDGALATIAAGLKDLSYLNISQCKSITAAGVSSLQSMKSLKTLIFKVDNYLPMSNICL